MSSARARGYSKRCFRGKGEVRFVRPVGILSLTGENWFKVGLGPRL